MEITPVGVFYLLLTIVLFLKKKELFNNLLIVCIITEMFVENGFFLKIGSTDIFFSGYIQFLLLIICLFKYVSGRFRLSKLFFFLNISFVIPIILLLLLPSNLLVANGYVLWDDVVSGDDNLVPITITTRVIYTTMKCIFASFIFMYIYECYSFQMYKELLIKISRIINYFLLLAIIEFIIKNLLGGNEMWGSFVETMFGHVENAAFEGRERGNIYEICLFTKETSHFAYSLLLCLLIKMASNIANNKKFLFDLSMLLTVVLAFICTSFSSFLFLFAFVCIFFTNRWRVRVVPSTTLEMSVITVILLLAFSSTALFSDSDSFVLSRLSNFVVNMDYYLYPDGNFTSRMGDFSTYVRLLSIIQTFQIFLERPFFGFSLSSAVCHGSTIMLLSGIGLIGTYIVIRFYFYSIPMKKQLQTNNYLYLFFIIIYLGINIFNSLSVRPFYEFSFLIIIVSFNIILSKKLTLKK